MRRVFILLTLFIISFNAFGQTWDFITIETIFGCEDENELDSYLLSKGARYFKTETNNDEVSYVYGVGISDDKLSAERFITVTKNNENGYDSVYLTLKNTLEYIAIKNTLAKREIKYLQSSSLNGGRTLEYENREYFVYLSTEANDSYDVTVFKKKEY